MNTEITRTPSLCWRVANSQFFAASLIVLTASVCLLWQRSTRAEEESLALHISPGLVENLKAILQEKAPEGKVIDNGDPGIFIFTYHLRDFECHNLSDGDNYSVRIVKRTMPEIDGFEITLSASPPPEPASEHPRNNYYGRIHSRDYWRDYHNMYKVRNENRYLRLTLRFGTLANQETLVAVKKTLADVGDPVYQDVQDGWEEKSAMARDRLTMVVNELQSKAIWRQDGRSLVCEYNIKEYQIYPIDGMGQVATTTHRETGPGNRGFIIRLIPVEPPLRRQSRIVSGRSHGPYWEHYSSIYDEDSNPIRLEILYDVSTDRRLLEAVTAVLDVLFSESERF